MAGQWAQDKICSEIHQSDLKNIVILYYGLDQTDLHK